MILLFLVRDMVQTRAQARREQSSRPVAPLGVNSPQREGERLRAGVRPRRASVDVTGATNAGWSGQASGARRPFLAASIVCDARQLNKTLFTCVFVFVFVFVSVCHTFFDPFQLS